MKKSTLQKIAGVLIPTALMLGTAAPVFAEDIRLDIKTDVDGSAGTRGTNVSANLETRTAVEVENRIKVLNALLERMNSMKRVSASVKTNVASSIAANITALSDLKAKLATDSPADLKADMLLVTKGTRVYALLVPQTRILLAADRANVVAEMLTGVDAKIKARITTATTAGIDVKEIVALEADMSAKIATAKLQAAAAISAVSGLTPDNGNQAKMTANLAALKAGRTALKAAEAAIRDANKDFKAIVVKFRAQASVSAIVQ